MRNIEHLYLREMDTGIYCSVEGKDNIKTALPYLQSYYAYSSSKRYIMTNFL
jgi:hypothetical protein